MVAPGSSYEDLVAAVAEAEVMFKEGRPLSLSAEDLAEYIEKGFLVARGVVPARLADVIREQIMHPGLLLDGRKLDVHDPTTWGKGGIAKQKETLKDSIISSWGSESEYSGVRIGFRSGVPYKDGMRPDLEGDARDLLLQAWNLAQNIAERNLRAVMDRIAGAGTYEEGRLKTDIIVRYSLVRKDPTRHRVGECKWPRFGWHIDGKCHKHLLGHKVELGGESGLENKGSGERKPDHASVAMLVWNRTLPHGGMTGAIPGSHKTNMQKIIKSSESGGYHNAHLLVHQSLLGASAVDPITATHTEQLLHPGDCVFMHPYLTHSVAWNFQEELRLGMHLQFNYNEPMDTEAIKEMARRQASAECEGELPANTRLFLEGIEVSASRSWFSCGRRDQQD